VVIDYAASSGGFKGGDGRLFLSSIDMMHLKRRENFASKCIILAE